MCQIAYKYTGNKICYKIDKFAFDEDRRKVVRGTVLLCQDKEFWVL